MLPLAAFTAWLGFWQLDRMSEKQDLINLFENAPSLDLSLAVADERQFARVQTSGRYESSWHLLLDNKIQDGRVGVHVISLFRPVSGMPTLVNRGWLPLSPRRIELPEFDTPSDQLTISGILLRPVTSGIQLGEPEHLDILNGPRLITYLDMSEIEDTLNGDLSPWMIQLDSREATGFGNRDWKPAVILPPQHRAYAVQWFALAIAIVIFWLVLSWRPGRRPNTGLSPDSHNHNREDS